MIIYCDTSLLVPLLVSEVFSDLAERWFSEQPHEALAFSNWTDAEVASALAGAQRSRRLDDAGRARALGLWHGLSRGMTRAEATADDFATVPRLVDSGARGLRASDALHLAVVLRLDLALATFDRDLAAAAVAEGVEVAVAPPTA